MSVEAASKSPSERPLRAGFVSTVGPYIHPDVWDEFSSIPPIEQEHSSDLSPENKRSESFYMCIGIIITGIDAESDNPVSFLMHFSPLVHFSDEKKKGAKQDPLQKAFLEDFAKKVAAFKKAVKPGTMSAVVIGGHTPDIDAYNRAVDALGKVLQKGTGVALEVASRPSEEGGFTHVYVDTKNKRIHIVRADPPRK